MNMNWYYEYQFIYSRVWGFGSSHIKSKTWKGNSMKWKIEMEHQLDISRKRLILAELLFDTNEIEKQTKS